MVATETKFRVWAKKEYPTGFIKKIPDYKQLGNVGAVGLPDYVVIWKRKTIWWEVKSGFGNTLNFKSHFTDGQKITFIKMFIQCANIKVYCFTKSKGRQIVDFSKILKYGRIKFK